MKRFARPLSFVFAAAFLVATLLNASLVGSSRQALARAVARGSSVGPPERWLVVAIIPEAGDSFFEGLVEGIARGAPEAGMAVLFHRYPESEPDEALRWFETALAARVDGVIMYTSGDDPVSELARRARREGVVFVPVGRDPPPGTLAGFIGSGSLRQGREAGRIIGEGLGSAARVGVILPTGEGGASEDEPLYRGLAEGLSPWPGATIMAAVRSGAGVLAGEQAASELVRANPGINALFCGSSVDTVGAAQVVVDLALVGRVLIVGTDETAEIGRYVDRSVVAASIVRDSPWIGGEAVRSFAALAEGKEPGRNLEAGYYILTASDGAQK
ncbi:MAG: substrate-binding domain-containing protein [Spirochaetales bacterium]|nr:substrate-binding domain-containing protein [Spirochaetales bacterium]